MASKTALAESSQALFCSIADYVGITNVKQILNIENYDTYESFKENHDATIKLAYKRIKTPGVSLDQIERFLSKENSWYDSSVLIGRKLVEELRNIDLDFNKITRNGFQEIFYFRDDRQVMGSISELFKIARKNGVSELKNQPQLSDINKWNPADIYFSSIDAQTKLVAARKKYTRLSKALTFTELNLLISELIDSGDLLPISLKKTNNSVEVKKVNFDRKKELEDFKKIKITGVSDWKPYVKVDIGKKTETRDLRVILESGEIKIRHVPGAIGKSSELRVEYIPTGRMARGGAIGSAKIFADIINFVDPSFATKILSLYKQGETKFKAEKNIISKTKMKKEESDFLIAESSGLNVVNKIMPELKKYFKNDANRNELIRLVYEYTTSRTALSGKFVIVK